MPGPESNPGQDAKTPEEIQKTRHDAERLLSAVNDLNAGVEAGEIDPVYAAKIMDKIVEDHEGQK